LWLSVASMGATFFGIPGSSPAFDVLAKLTGYRPSASRSRIDTADSQAALLRFRQELFASRTAGAHPASGSPRSSRGSLDAASSPANSPGGAARSISSIVYSAARDFGLSGSYLLSVARCESELDPRAVSAAGYYGLFQFDQGTWASYGYGSIYDPVAQAQTAARLMAAGQTGRWPNCI
jgi:soluble lytic murein transglycosylase-like protein